MTTETKKTVNGVSVETVMGAVEAMKADASLGEFRFRASNQWLDGMKNRSTIQSFFGAGQEDATRAEPYVMTNDEPPVLAGRDEGANPVEYLLNALAGCMTTTMVAHSATRGVEIESVESHLEGEIDVRGFLGIANDVPKGYRKIRVKFRVKSEADAAKLKELAQMSPVYNTITRPTPIEIEIEKA